jgi:nitrite reductase/ring-hydroxylating ferredoxin subunit
MDEAGVWTRVAAAEDVPQGEPWPVEVQGRQLALYRVGAEWFCTDNVCTHAFALLSDGWLEGHVIECPLHNGQFDIRTGRGLGPPITEDLHTFPVRVDGEEVLVALP